MQNVKKSLQRWATPALSLSLLLAGCGSGKSVGAPCTLDAECGSDACVLGTCVATQPAVTGGDAGGASGAPAPSGRCTSQPAGGNQSVSIGVCSASPFDLGLDPNNGVSQDDDGSLYLDATEINDAIIWIANTEEGTVSKFDTRTLEELGRYITGPDGSNNDPSRTSVNTFSDVYIGNREAETVTKISSLGQNCPDTNGDGVVTTSTGPTDILPWGEDDCVLWNRSLDGRGKLRGVAAHDVDGLDGVLFSYVWIGGYDGVVWKLDGETGDVLLETEASVAPYGFALDRAGNLWMSTRTENAIGRIDTTRCVDTLSCEASICDGEGVGDECVKQRIELPDKPYGITVDASQRVWLGGGDITRYDPAAPLGSRVTTVDLPYGDDLVVHGIAADGAGYVWGAATGHGVIQVDADVPSLWTVVSGTESYSNKGMAIDVDGKVWSITRDDRAVVITPGADLGIGTVNPDVARSIVGPYTYSDMTGQQLRLATTPRGFYRHIFEGCGDGADSSTSWLELHWNGELRSGTTLAFRVRTADTRAELATSMWVTAATAPPMRSPVSLSAILSDASVTPGRFLEIEAQLTRLETSETARLHHIEAIYGCPADLI